MTHLQVRRRLLLGAAGAMAAPWVHAQSSSDAPVRLVVPFTAGTGIDLLARAKAQPGSLNYGSPGIGTPHHLAMELLKSRAKISLTHVSYRGTGPAVTDLLGGQIDVMFLPIHVALQHIKAGKLKALAIGSEAEHAALPGVPTLKTLNVGNLNVDMWYALFAPAGTPAALVEQLNQALGQILAQPEVARAFATQGMEPTHSTPQELGRLMAADSRRWAELIKAQNIKAE